MRRPRLFPTRHIAQIGAAFVVLLAAGGPTVCADKPTPSIAALTDATTSPDSTPRLRYRIAVDQMKWNEIRDNQWNLPPDVREGIQSQLIDKLQKSGYFIVMEREATAMDQMNQEDQISQKRNATLPDGTTAPPARQQRTPAAYIITPTVIGMAETGNKKSGFNIGGIGIGTGKTTDTVTLNIRISDAQTSTMLDTQTCTGSSESKGSGFNFGTLYTTDQFQSSPAGAAVDKALDDAVQKIVARLSQEPWTALVAMQDKVTKRVIINAGKLAGVQIGQTFDILRAGQAITDPATGEVISQGDEVKVGRIKIVRVEQNASYADVLAGTSFLPRDIVRSVN